MRIARAIGTVTLSRSHPSLHAASFRLVLPLALAELVEAREPAGDLLVAYDELGASAGSRVAMSEGREAAQPFGTDHKPVDAYIAAILDRIDLEVPS
jgi:microcompartment protein CcmK/EutM